MKVKTGAIPSLRCWRGSSQETTRSSQAGGSELKPRWEPAAPGRVEPGEGLLVHVKDTCTSPFLVIGSVSTHLPSLLPSWLATGQILISESLNTPTLIPSLIYLCSKHLIPVMLQALRIALDI